MNWRYAILAGSGVALAGVGAYLLREKSTEDGDGGDGGENTDANPGTEADPLKDGDPPPIGDPRWGKGIPQGVQKQLRDITRVAKLPYFWAIGVIITKREAGFSATAHNDSKGEVDASTLGVERGLKRGNPIPAFENEVAAFGSGGLFGALASSFTWIGLDSAFMPFLQRRPELMFEPEASCVFGAHYFWRITQPAYANGRKLTMFDVRTGWASPDALKNSPEGKTAQGVRARMLEDIQDLGWDYKWVESLPVIRSSYAGIKSVASHYGYKPTQKD